MLGVLGEVGGVAITASGGGHTGYAVALAQHLQGRAEVTFIIPSGDSWSRSLVERYGDVVELPRSREPWEPLSKLVFRMPKVFIKGLGAVSRDCSVFVSTGSNHSVPPALAARLKGLKLYNLECADRIARPSLAARWLRPVSHVTALQWEEQRGIHPNGVVYGPFYELPKYKPVDGGYILVAGGTYGHRLLFNLVSDLELDRVVLQTGRVDPKPYVERHPEWTAFQFDPDFGRWLAKASVVVSSLGKTVLDAALTYRKPTVIVPNPEWLWARSRDVWRDARLLAGKLNAVVVEELSPKALLEAIEEAKRRKPPAYPNGAERLAKEILEVLG